MTYSSDVQLDHYISTAYLKLVLAAHPEIETTLEQVMGRQYQRVLEQEFMCGQVFERLFPALRAMGVNSLLLSFGRQIHLASHGPVGVAAVSAPNLQTSLSTLVDFTGVRSNLYTSQLVIDSNTLTVSVEAHPNSPLVRQWLTEIALDLCRAIIETTMGHDISRQTQVTFRQPAPAYRADLERFMGIACQFNAPLDSISFPSSWADVRSPLADTTSYISALSQCRELYYKLNHIDNCKTFVQHTLEQHFSAGASQHSLSETRSQPLAEDPLSPPKLTDIAQSLHVTPRTLTRKLDALGSSYKEILANVRNSQAKALLRSTHLNVAEIAYLLGYKETANFTRAFKSWNNCTPLAWRKSP